MRFDGKPSVDWTVTRNVVQEGEVTNYSLTYTNTLVAAAAAQSGMDMPYGGAGADWLLGGGGDSYDFALGDSQDTVQDEDGFDVVLLPVNLADLRVEMVEGSPGYLGIAYADSGSIVIRCHSKRAADRRSVSHRSFGRCWRSRIRETIAIRTNSQWGLFL